MSTDPADSFEVDVALAEPFQPADDAPDESGDYRAFDVESRPLTPEARIRNPSEAAQGYEVPLAGGLKWTLFPFGAGVGDSEVALIQDELYEALAYDGKVAKTLLYRAFEAAIRINYDVSSGEAAVLFFSVAPEHREPAPGGGYLEFSLAQAVIASVLPSECPADVTYSDWLTSSLLVNGIAPESVPPERLPAVLRHLVALGLAVPPERMVSAAIRGAERSKGRALAIDPIPAG